MTKLKKTLYFSLSLFCLLSFNLFASYTVIEDKMTEKIKSPGLQNVKFKKILLSNGLNALLVSDPEAKKSGAALSVGVGWNNEPFDHIGVAHFVEHMLFMGTNKYPAEKEYFEYIESNGGLANAYTSTDRTVYSFEINNEQILETLDRFSSFFVCPTFNSSGLERERKAVNQEFLYRANLDHIRGYMIRCSLLNPKTHANIWRCGTEETLSQVSRDEIVDWYQKNYSANIMKLCVYSSLPMDKLVGEVDKCFSQIENKNFKPKRLSYPVSLPEKKSQMVYIEPLQDIKKLEIAWEVPPEFNNDLDFHTADLVSYVLSEESPKSLSAALKEKGYIHGLGAFHSPDDKNVSFFVMNFELTEAGLQNKEDVIATCFKAIATLKESGIPRYRFDEMTTLAKLDYAYQSRPEAYSFVEAVAAGLQNENLDTFPQKSSWPSYYDSNRVQDFLSCLKPTEANFFVMAPGQNIGKAFDQVEDFAKISYTVEPVSKKMLSNWQNAKAVDYIAVAKPNAFIPNNFELVTTKNDYSSDKNPQILLQDDRHLIYYAADQDYHLPEASYEIKIATPSINESPESKALCDLFYQSIYDALSASLEQASLAGLNASFQLDSKHGFTVSVQGYNHKAQLLLNQIINEAISHLPKEKDFGRYHDRLLRLYQNKNKQIPLRQAMESMQNLIIKDYASIDAKIQSLQKINYADFLGFCQTLFENTFVKGMIYGNVNKKEAEREIAYLNEALNHSKSYPIDQHYQRAILELSAASSPRYYDETSSQEGNAAYLIVSHGILEAQQRAAFDVLSKAISVPFSETLRTKQQVGYIVRSFPSGYDKKLFTGFMVQSNSCSTRDLLARYELFNEEFLASLGKEEFNEEKFDMIRKALITEYLQPEVSISAKANKLTRLAFDYDGEFNLNEQRAEALQKLSFDDFANFCYSELGRGNSRRLAILVNGKMNNVPTLTYEPILDVKNFKADSYYQIEKPFNILNQNELTYP